MPRKLTINDFWNRVTKTDGCWLYNGFLYPKGYGSFSGQYAHRFSYKTFKGEIPEGLFVCHTCDVRNCVNPDHLFLGTHQDNMDDMVRKERVADTNLTKHIGSKNGRAKLTDDDVRDIRSQCDPYKHGIYRRLAAKYGVTPEMISYVARKKNWTHV